MRIFNCFDELYRSRTILETQNSTQPKTTLIQCKFAHKRNMYGLKYLKGPLSIHTPKHQQHPLKEIRVMVKKKMQNAT